MEIKAQKVEEYLEGKKKVKITKVEKKMKDGERKMKKKEKIESENQGN